MTKVSLRLSNHSPLFLGLPNERAIPINADHRQMARLSPRSANQYLPVWKTIAELVNGKLRPRPFLVLCVKNELQSSLLTFTATHGQRPMF
jgi:hypothetical protein